MVVFGRGGGDRCGQLRVIAHDEQPARHSDGRDPHNRGAGSRHHDRPGFHPRHHLSWSDDSRSPIHSAHHSD
jgi:hypothetical protein